MEKTRTTEVAPLIEIKQLNKYYQTGDQPLHVLNSIDLTIYRNDFVSIMGPSGSGKSTLINVLGFLDHEFEGDYLFEGQPIEQRTDQQISKLRNQIVGFVFQDFNLIGNMTVEENVRLPLIYKGLRAKETKELVQTALDRVGLGDKLKQKPSQLSGGQKQRVAIARVLVNQPEFIIADEPTGALDTKTSAAIMAILSKLHAEDGVTIIMVTHDPNMQRFATRHIRIVDGQIQSNASSVEAAADDVIDGSEITKQPQTQPEESRV
ncbi:ABC transporter ATP-binding protein [Fundicoccus ignavus]|uniref:ABC transporter ATP-binding protein n=1 Tax=Fundicoccus ignavus TaxID=2664442 RepID=UPI003458954A